MGNGVEIRYCRSSVHSTRKIDDESNKNNGFGRCSEEKYLRGNFLKGREIVEDHPIVLITNY
jgi:hypothetical protein